MENGFPVNFQILQTALWSAPTGILISDNNLPDNPIIYCNPQFTAVSGYHPDEVIGKNCRFLQGEDTDRNEVHRLRAALAAGDAFQGDLLNYRKDGTPFWNQLTLSPIRNETDQITHFIGFQNDITRRVEAEKICKAPSRRQRKSIPTSVSSLPTSPTTSKTRSQPWLFQPTRSRY